jgi:hypothetical protein
LFNHDASLVFITLFELAFKANYVWILMFTFVSETTGISDIKINGLEGTRASA